MRCRVLLPMLCLLLPTSAASLKPFGTVPYSHDLRLSPDGNHLAFVGEDHCYLTVPQRDHVALWDWRCPPSKNPEIAPRKTRQAVPAPDSHLKAFITVSSVEFLRGRHR